jgi:2-polyprenyl-3-methyl-5-hydroxy-6-metoxy-1,4-benzoquinol methylase
MDKKLVRDIVQWDVRCWSNALYFWENALGPNLPQGRCLELGAREGGLSLWLALKGMEVVCSDLYQPELHASPLHQRYNVSSRIRYLTIDASNIPFENHFDVIVYKSMLGAVGYGNHHDKQQLAMLEILKALKPGGKLLFAENLTATSIHAWLRKHVIKGYARSWRYITIPEMQSFLKGYSQYEMHATGLLPVLGRTEMLKNLLALMDEGVFNRIVPDSWKCLVYGIAVK